MKKEETRFAAGTLFEGMTSIRAVLTAMETGVSDRRILRLLVASEKKKARAKELGWLAHQAKKHGFAIEEITEAEMNTLVTGSTHGGLVAECSTRDIPMLTAEAVKPNGFYALLEGIEDPYNFGYALRSLYACSVDGILLSPRNWMTAAGVVCRASAGASELLPLYICDSVESATMMRACGYRVICAGIRDSISSFDADLRKPIYLIIGGEKRGISSALLAMADAIVRIDYGRAFNGSLSAASATAMLGYEVLRQNR